VNPQGNKERRDRVGKLLWLAVLVVVAAIAFALGSWRPGQAPVSAAPPDAGITVTPPEPRIVFDPASIGLLPDASLRLDLPEGFDAGPAP
jgi:hypothetical protein